MDALLLNRQPLPEALLPPIIRDGYESWVYAFWELSTDRHIAVGMGGAVPGPIPAASIRAHTAGWDPDEAEFFRKMVRAMDAVYLADGKDPVPPPPPPEDGDEAGPTVNHARDRFRAVFKR